MSDIPERKLTAWFGVALALLIVNGLLSSWNVRSVVIAGTWVVHTREVLGVLDGMVSAIREAEADQRDYLISGQVAYLSRLDEIGEELSAGLLSLKRLTSDNRAQQQSIDKLGPAIERRLQLLHANVNVRRAQGFEAARRVLATGDGKLVMDEINALIHELKSREDALLAERTTVAKSSIWWAAGNFTFATFLALGLLGVAYHLVRRYLRERKREEAAAEERQRLANLGVDVGAALVQGESLPEILRLCCVALVRHLEGAFARIWTLNEAEDTLVLQASAGEYTHTNGPHSRIRVGDFKIGLIAKERQPHLTNTAIDDPRVSDPEWARREGMVAFGGYPLLVEDRLVGVMAMFARHPLSEAAIQAMGTVASGIALGIERKHAELDAQQSADRVRLLLDSTGEGIFGVDLDGRCTFCNAAGLKILGYNDERQLLGKNMHGMIHHSLPDRTPYPEAECPLSVAFRAGLSAYSDDDYFWRADGKGFPVEYRCSPIRGGEKILGAVVTFLDVTRRRSIENTMRLRERALRSIAQGIFIIDPSRADEPIIYVNAAFEQMTGYRHGEVFGHDIRFLQGPRTDLEALRTISAALVELREVAVELVGYRKDGTEFWAALSIAPVLDVRGRVTHFVGVMTDITARKRAEDELKEAKETAEAASRSKSTFLANMSHELRTPLNAIIGYSEMLKEEAEESGQQGAASDLEKIRSSGKHLLGLINDILDLSKVEAGKMDLFRETFNVREMIGTVIHTIKPLVDQNSNTLNVECSDNLGEMYADLTKVRQVLLNVLSNASKFTERGMINLRVCREEIEGRDWVAFEVIDSGIGMTSGQIAKLFQPFVQADASTTRKYGGTGLGLSITRRFCQLMGGDITVGSEPGRGSTFTIRIPTLLTDRATSSVGANGTAANLAGGPGSLVLVIDDDPLVHELLKRTLGKDGFHVACAAGGEDGLRLAREIHPDVITLDVMMPGMDGWEVLSVLKSDPELADTPVVMVTMIDDKNLGYALGASDYLTKPIDRVRLAAILKRHREKCAADCIALVVEDDRVSRHMVCEILEKDGWTVVEAENGRVALERIRERPPHLIVLDLMMPELDGFGLTEELRRHEEFSEIPILVLTAKDLTEEDRLRLNGEVLCYLQKGASTRDDLLREIRRAVAVHIRRKAAATACPLPSA